MYDLVKKTPCALYKWYKKYWTIVLITIQLCVMFINGSIYVISKWLRCSFFSTHTDLFTNYLIFFFHQPSFSSFYISYHPSMFFFSFSLPLHSLSLSHQSNLPTQKLYTQCLSYSSITTILKYNYDDR